MSELKLRPPKTMEGDRWGRPCKLRAGCTGLNCGAPPALGRERDWEDFVWGDLWREGDQLGMLGGQKRRGWPYEKFPNELDGIALQAKWAKARWEWCTKRRTSAWSALSR